MAATHENSGSKIKVAIIGAGLSGLAVANGLLNDETSRFDVQIYERDTIAFDSERGGYQIRIASNGLQGLKAVADTDLWNDLRNTWAGDASRAPAMVDPKDFSVHLELSKFKAYPASRPVPRVGLRRALLRRPLAESRVHFDHKLESFEHVNESDHGMALHFDKSRSATADILIAADGSNSQVNRQVGINNKVKLDTYMLIQSRGTISDTMRRTLPTSLLECGSLLFLGGRRATGFASIYDPGIVDEAGQEKNWNLFWSILIPVSLGESFLEKANGDHDMLVSLTTDYLRRDLKYGESLPTIMNAATQNLRTGRLTSSFKPMSDWRKGTASNSRVILLGDAIHPMTPGRGQGANQALTDAGHLVKLFRKTQFNQGSAIEKELSVIVKEFDEEMYERAFKMVKNSEQVTDLDLTSFPGRALCRVVGWVLTITGWGMSVLERIGLKHVENLDFDSLTA